MPSPRPAGSIGLDPLAAYFSVVAAEQTQPARDSQQIGRTAPAEVEGNGRWLSTGTIQARSEAPGVERLAPPAVDQLLRGEELGVSDPLEETISVLADPFRQEEPEDWGRKILDTFGGS
jgi:hypothetical protein